MADNGKIPLMIISRSKSLQGDLCQGFHVFCKHGADGQNPLVDPGDLIPKPVS